MLLLSLFGRWPLVGQCLRSPVIRRTLIASTLLIAGNWYVYIYSVVTNQILQSSLGYFINPLLNVVLGMIFFGERLRAMQWWAVALASVGVACMTLFVGELPWIALSLAVCFGLYGLLRKTARLMAWWDLSVEVFLLAPIAAGYVIYVVSNGLSAFGQFGVAVDSMLLASGVVTALPLMCFAQAARRLRLSTMGFLQFISPTLQFGCALALGEPLSGAQLAAFVAIWCALAIYSVDAVLARRPAVAKSVS